MVNKWERIVTCYSETLTHAKYVIFITNPWDRHRNLIFSPIRKLRLRDQWFNSSLLSQQEEAAIYFKRQQFKNPLYKRHINSTFILTQINARQWFLEQEEKMSFHRSVKYEETSLLAVWHTRFFNCSPVGVSQKEYEGPINTQLKNMTEEMENRQFQLLISGILRCFGFSAIFSKLIKVLQRPVFSPQS